MTEYANEARALLNLINETSIPEATLEAARFGAISHVIGAFAGLAFAGAAAYAALRMIRKMQSGTVSDEMVMLLGLGAAMACIVSFVLMSCGLVDVLNLAAWAGMWSPEIWLASEIIDSLKTP